MHKKKNLKMVFLFVVVAEITVKLDKLNSCIQNAQAFG